MFSYVPLSKVVEQSGTIRDYPAVAALTAQLAKPYRAAALSMDKACRAVDQARRL
jgi:hypothetical protein